MITISDRSYILGVWAVATDRCEWVACVWRDDPCFEWIVRSRIRTTMHDHIASWSTMHLRADTSEERIIVGMGNIARRQAKLYGAHEDAVASILVRGGVEVARETFLRSILFHAAANATN